MNGKALFISHFFMKKIFTLLFITLFSFQMQGQNAENLIPNSNVGIYYMCTNTVETPVNTTENRRILKVVFPLWTADGVDTVSIPHSLPEGITVSKTIEIRPTTKLWRIGTTKCFSTDSTSCLGLEYTHEGAKSKTFYLKKGQSSTIATERQIRSASLSFISVDSVSFDDMQKIELEKHPLFTYFKDTLNKIVYIVPNYSHFFYWYENAPECTFTTTAPTVRQVQEKLREKGYDCPLNNIMGKETKAALVQFQKDNGIPTCGYELLPALFPPPPPSEDDLKLQRLNEW